MKIETPFIAVILGVLFFTGIFTMFLSLSNTYGVPVDMSMFNTQGNTSSLQDTFFDINQSKAEMDEVTKGFNEATLGDSNDVFEFLRMTWQMGKQVFANMFLLQDILMAVTQMFGIPAEIVVTLLTILFLIFIISVVMIIIGRTYE